MTIATDHAYHLYSALSRALPSLHSADAGPRFRPIRGRPAGKGRLLLARSSHLRLRLEADQIPAVLPLAGGRLDLGGDFVRPFVVVEPDGHLPYTKAGLDAARDWLVKLPATNASQRDPADRWEQTADGAPEGVASAWVNGGPKTTVKDHRKPSPGITARGKFSFRPLLVEDRVAQRFTANLLAEVKEIRPRAGPLFPAGWAVQPLTVRS